MKRFFLKTILATVIVAVAGLVCLATVSKDTQYCIKRIRPVKANVKVNGKKAMEGKVILGSDRITIPKNGKVEIFNKATGRTMASILAAKKKVEGRLIDIICPTKKQGHRAGSMEYLREFLDGRPLELSDTIALETRMSPRSDRNFAFTVSSNPQTLYVAYAEDNGTAVLLVADDVFHVAGADSTTVNLFYRAGEGKWDWLYQGLPVIRATDD